MPANESYVQIAPDSSGKKVRNIKATVYVEDATVPGKLTQASVLLQVTALSDERGNIINKFIDYEYQARVIELLTQIRDGISILSGKPLGD
jgi:hypothetical protein